MEEQNSNFLPRLRSALAQERGLMRFEWLHFAEVGSTQDVARDRLRGEAREAIVLADRQTAGRGRHGRSWVSTHPDNVYLSMGLRDWSRNRSLGDLSVRLAEAIAEEFDTRFSVHFAIRPPNDLLLGGEKVGGILLETMADGEGIVIGIGLNLVPDPTLQGHCAQPVGAIGPRKFLDRVEAVPALCRAVLVATGVGEWGKA